MPAKPKILPVDKALEAGSSAHYEDPSYYTKTYKNRLSDVRYYTDLAEVSKGSVLEYGCGNGRITIPLARTGVAVTGVDLSEPMLDDFRKRLQKEPKEVQRNVSLRHGDMRTLKLKKRFALVFCPFNAFLHLYTRQDVEQFLARVRAHLAPRGEFVFDISIPEPIELSREPSKLFRTPRFLYPRPGGESLIVKYGERFDYDKVRQVLFVSMEFEPEDGSGAWTTPLTHRQFYPAELEALLHYNGFEILAQLGDFDGSLVGPNSDKLILRCRAKR